MTSPPTIDCTSFDQHAEDLALGHVDEPLRTELLGHAADCMRCRHLLEGLGAVVDGLLAAAPGIEPPAGFESRALARIGPDPAIGSRRSPSGWWAAAAVVLVVAALGIGVAAVRDGSSTTTRTAAIVATDGTALGSVELVGDPAPHVLVAIPDPRPAPGVRHCELKTSSGAWVQVGSWELADIARGVWATGIDRALLDATAMRITTDDGTVLALARFS